MRFNSKSLFHSLTSLLPVSSSALLPLSSHLSLLPLSSSLAYYSTRPLHFNSTAIGIYIHWPYCSKICPYCSFNKTLDSPSVNHSLMYDCILKELTTMLSLVTPRTVHSVYFGGGTPSLAQPILIEKTLNLLTSTLALQMASNLEVTLEVNPIHCFDSDKGLMFLKRFAAAGVTRCSLGVQSFNDSTLRRLGRDHTGAQALHAIENCKKIFENRTSFDLIFAAPDQSLSDWESDIQTAVQNADSHISLYHLSIEKGTHFFNQFSKGKLLVPSDDSAADMLDTAVHVFEQNGLHRYEVANFAKPNCESRHNLNYWAGNDYLGIGPGAHGRITVTNTPLFTSLLGDQAKISKRDMFRAEQQRPPQQLQQQPQQQTQQPQQPQQKQKPLQTSPSTITTETFATTEKNNTSWTRIASVQQRHTPVWMENVQFYNHACKHITIQSPLERLSELLTMGLRTVSGISTLSWEYYRALFQSTGGSSEASASTSLPSLEALFLPQSPSESSQAQKILEQLRADKMIVLDNEGLRVVKLNILDSIMPWILLRLEEFFFCSQKVQ